MDRVDERNYQNMMNPRRVMFKFTSNQIIHITDSINSTQKLSLYEIGKLIYFGYSHASIMLACIVFALLDMLSLCQLVLLQAQSIKSSQPKLFTLHFCLNKFDKSRINRETLFYNLSHIGHIRIKTRTCIEWLFSNFFMSNLSSRVALTAVIMGIRCILSACSL